ncbi:MAG: type II toxin-antitoxin system VapC family toxin [Spirochaetia bacterium]|jgi:predicted nucleic acid-binding protein|nr:type II toxin-antitoxin system VapC family toxin [Spirochaetia bacterium]
MGCLIDSCIWIDVERGIISPSDVALYTGINPVYISPVSLAELGYGVEMSVTEEIRHKRASSLERLRKKPLLIIDDGTGLIFARLAAVLNKSGRGSSFRIQDIWLASQAIQNNFFFLTKNKKDFADIPGLKLIVFGD